MSRAIKSELAVAAAVLTVLLGAPVRAAEPTAAEHYATHCAQCHGADRLGQTGPALIPEALVRFKKAAAVEVIAGGRAATQMPAFATTLSKEAIAALAEYIYTPIKSVPAWGKEQIEATRVKLADAPTLAKPTFSADPLNLFVVVESGDHHVTILDGDTFTPMTRFASRFALHGGPKFTPDGRFVFFMSRDGWVTKYDLWSQQVLAETRAGLNARNIALSKDGRHVAVANYLPHTLVILSAADLSVERIFEVKDAKGATSRVSAVYQAPQRDSFIVALKDVGEVWEVSTSAKAAEPLALRRIAVEEPLDDFFFDQSYRHLLGSARDGKNALVLDLDAGKAVARIDMPGMPHLGSGITFQNKGRSVVSIPHLKEGVVSIVDLANWSVVKRLPMHGPGFFMRSHERSAFIWADAMMGPKKDTLALIDKETLEVARTLTPAPGKTAAHVEFDRTGRHALVSVWENDGALVIYDAQTFAEVKRLPMSKPSGKYNVYNKITFGEGTSH